MNLKLLSKDAQALYNELHTILSEASILTAKDNLALQMLAITYNTYLEATKHILKNGSTVIITNTNGETVERPSPYIKIQLDSQIQLFKLLEQFYLIPKSRNKLEPESKEELSPMERVLGVIEKRTNEPLK